MTKFRVFKCKRVRCLCHEQGTSWHVVRVRGLEKRLMCSWAGQATALYAALELAGLAKTPEPTC